ncbi:MAG: CDP-alcohol phosphatidyltransferase family protein [Persicimonas sp.]
MDESRMEAVLLALSPGLALGAALVVAFGIFLIRSPREHELASRSEGSALLPAVFIQYFYWLTDPVARALSGAGIRPNHITGLSVVVAAGAAYALAAGYFMVGVWIFFVAITCDLLDGLAARSQNAESAAGAFFDSWADRVTEGLVLGGLALYGRDTLLGGLSLWALVASYLISYARARGEALGVSCKVGLMQRPERMFLLVIAIFFSPLAALWLEPGAQRPVFHVAQAGVGLLALLSTVTALRRARWIAGALDDEESKLVDESDEAPDNQLSKASDSSA